MQIASPAMQLCDAPSTIHRTKVDTALTAVLIVSDDLGLRGLCLQRIREGRSRIDSRLVLDLYAACDRNLKLQLACSAVVSRLPPRAFRQIFNDAYNQPGLNNNQRHHLAWTLENFLWSNPRGRHAYLGIVMELLESRSVDLRCRALTLAGQMRKLDARALAIYDRSLSSKRADFRVNALNGLFKQVEQIDKIAPRFREFVLSDEFKLRVSRLRRSDPDEHVRKNARVLLGLLRRVKR